MPQPRNTRSIGRIESIEPQMGAALCDLTHSVRLLIASARAQRAQANGNTRSVGGDGFAARAYVGESTAGPAKYYDKNIGGRQSAPGLRRIRLQTLRVLQLGCDLWLARAATPDDDPCLSGSMATERIILQGS